VLPELMVAVETGVFVGELVGISVDVDVLTAVGV
jgi:hypothetical protein